MGYVPIILLAIGLNCWHKPSLLLTLAIALDLLIPVPKEYGAMAWYSMCAVIELIVLFTALSNKTNFSTPIAMLSVGFIFVHFLGWIFNGYLFGSPYNNFARTLEYTELFICIILSNPVVNFIKEKLR